MLHVPSSTVSSIVSAVSRPVVLYPPESTQQHVYESPKIVANEAVDERIWICKCTFPEAEMLNYAYQHLSPLLCAENPK